MEREKPTTWLHSPYMGRQEFQGRPQPNTETDIGLYAARLLDAHNEKREAITREEVTFHTPLPNLADCVYSATTERLGMQRPRETTNHAGSMEEAAAGESHLRRAEILLRRRQRRLQTAPQALRIKTPAPRPIPGLTEAATSPNAHSEGLPK